MPNITYLFYDKLGNFLLQKKLLESKFNNVPLIWMFFRKTCYSEIEKIHHETLEVIYNNNELYNTLLFQHNNASIHQRHLHVLMTEIYKSISQENPEFTW